MTMMTTTMTITTLTMTMTMKTISTNEINEHDDENQMMMMMGGRILTYQLRWKRETEKPAINLPSESRFLRCVREQWMGNILRIIRIFTIIAIFVVFLA